MSGHVKASRVTAAGAPDRRFGPRRPPNDRTFTPRERQVTELIATGASNDEIAELLGVSVAAVQDCRHRAVKRLGVAGLGVRADVMLTRHALREGWVSL